MSSIWFSSLIIFSIFVLGQSASKHSSIILSLSGLYVLNIDLKKSHGVFKLILDAITKGGGLGFTINFAK